MRALRALPHGSLTMTLPNGETLRFGSDSNPRNAQHGLDARIDVRDEAFFRRCFYQGDIGLAEGYMAGEWTTEDLAEVVAWFILNADGEPARPKLLDRLRHRFRANSVTNSRKNIEAHYDLSNEFFALFLDPSMTYSSAIFDGEPETLEEAQRAKYERLCQLLQLQEGDEVLEIGGGWGAFSRYAAQRYGCRVTTITISPSQYAWADRLRGDAPIDLRLIDYRRLTGSFDKIVSIEMLEAVGHEYFDAFFAKCSELLRPNGLAALQVITCPDPRYERMRRGVDFIQKHIFPGGLIPSVGALLASIQRTTDFVLRDLSDFGSSYARTLQLWSDRFEQNLDQIRALGFDDAFLRKWRYYFAYCMAAFQMRHVSVVQMLLTRPNNHAIA
ncbi:MAG: class I SAM-dependent methyltransferase [Acidobacteria bacterium]|nr:class I SAM-dependent methyltransferase [Acidobacteriota bacterium]